MIWKIQLRTKLMFRIKISEQYIDSVKGVDPYHSAMIQAWIQRNILRNNNPRSFGKSLFKKDNRFWQYRLGKYRVLAIIYDDSKVMVFANIHFDETTL